jgi:hypothetical protein
MGSVPKASDGVGVGRNLSKDPHHWSDHSALLPVLIEFFPEWTRATWCCALFQVEFHCLLVILLVDFLLPFSDNCACRTKALCFLIYRIEKKKLRKKKKKSKFANHRLLRNTPDVQIGSLGDLACRYGKCPPTPLCCNSRPVFLFYLEFLRGKEQSGALLCG